MQTERNGVFCTWYFSRINAKYLNAICPLLNKVIQAVGKKMNKCKKLFRRLWGKECNNYSIELITEYNFYVHNGKQTHR